MICNVAHPCFSRRCHDVHSVACACGCARFCGFHLFAAVARSACVTDAHVHTHLCNLQQKHAQHGQPSSATRARRTVPLSSRAPLSHAICLAEHYLRSTRSADNAEKSQVGARRPPHRHYHMKNVADTASQLPPDAPGTRRLGGN